MRKSDGAAAGADGIEQIEDALLRDLGGHGNLGGVEIGKAGANALRARDHAADAGGEIVGALVAEHLQRHAGRDAAFEGGIGGILAPGVGERGEKAAHGGTEAGAGDVDFHASGDQILAPVRRLGSSAFIADLALRVMRPHCRVVQRFGNHDLAHGFGGAVLGQARAAEAGA